MEYAGVAGEYRLDLGGHGRWAELRSAERHCGGGSRSGERGSEYFGSVKMPG